MKKVLILCGALVLAGCNVDPNVATPNQALIAVNAYNAGVAAGVNYLKLPLCPANAPVCRTAGLSQQVYTALKAGRVARGQVLSALAANTAAPITAIQALQTAYAVLQQIPVK